VTDRLGADDRGVASSVVTFLVAGVLFVGAVGVVLVTTKDSAQGSAAATAPAVQMSYQARNLAQTILMTPGITTTGDDWAAQPTAALGGLTGADQLRRLGLRDGSGSNPTVSFEKFQNLRLSPYEADATDGFVNYPEARTSLGLDAAGIDFHIRAYPSLKTVEEMLRTGYKDPNMRITYIGDIDVGRSGGPPPSNPTAGLDVGIPTCAVSPLTSAPNPQGYRLSVTVTNGGTVATQFTGLFTYQLGSSASQSQNANGYVVPPGGSTTLHVDVPAIAGRTCSAGSTISVEVTDPATARVTSSTTLASAVTGATAAPRDLWLDSVQPYRINSSGASCQNKERAKVTYFGDDLERNEQMALRLVDAAGNPVTLPSGSSSFRVPNSRGPWTVDLGCLVAGEYLATLYYGVSAPSASAEQVTERILVTTAELPGYSPGATGGATVYTPKQSAIDEVGFLDDLTSMFCPTYFDSTSLTPANYAVDWSTRCQGFKANQTQPGDVMPDSKQVMNNDLVERLLVDPSDPHSAPRYDLVTVLVAGSGLDQTAMTSQAAKGAVASWVLGGGTLIVLGSDAQNVNWLQPIFHAAIESSSGGLGVPDHGHPLLHTANELDYPHYDNYGHVWEFNGQTARNAASLFTDVVVQGNDPVTTISNPGALGSGTVILTAWEPHRVYNSTYNQGAADMEGRKLMQNLLVQGYRDLFLDYGPPLPDNTNVLPAVNIVSIRHPEFPDLIELKVDLYLFQ
jgi:hypothetical protein